MSNKQILVVDDELSNLNWLFEYLINKKIDFDVAENGQKAEELIKSNDYDLYLIDLNIPHDSLSDWKRDIYKAYPGLNVAQAVRTKGVSGGKVVIYSVHLTPELDHEVINRLSCRYVVKGRIKELKEVLRGLEG